MPDTTTDSEIRALEEFLVEAGRRGGEKFAELRAEAARQLRMLRDPIRIAVAGEFSSGKSTLVNILLGEDFAETGVMASDMPPVLFQFGESSVLSGGWWREPDRKPKRDGDVEALVAEAVDYITISYPASLLHRVEVLDVPGLNSLSRKETDLVDAISWADALIWCTNAVNAWRESERRTWSLLPEHVRDNGILVVTHVDLPAISRSVDRVSSRLKREAGGLFSGIVMLAAPKAMAAAPGGQIIDQSGWEASGGQHLLESISAIFAKLRSERRKQVQTLLAEKIAPAKAQLADLPVVRPGDVLSAWKAQTVALSMRVDDLDTATFCGLARDLLRTTTALLGQMEGAPARAAWLAGEFAAATRQAATFDPASAADAETLAMMLRQLDRELKRDLGAPG